MDIRKIPVKELNPAKYNPRKNLKPGDPEYEKLKRSITEFGYVEPIIWNKRTGNIVGGHQRYEVLLGLGYGEVDCVVLDIDEQKVILDELGYVSFDKSGCEILFNLLSNRNDKGSIIITTNLTFDRWEEIFKDTMLTGAMVDRLAHKAHILDISRPTSHRFEETISWLKTKE